jgi:hypothetical protein
MPFKDPAKRLAYQRKYAPIWEKKNHDKRIGYYRKYYYKHHERVLLRHRNQSRRSEQAYEVRARRYHRCRILILKRYSPKVVKCKNCGETRYECLQIDHTKDDGGKERKETGWGGSNFYEWLKKQPIDRKRYQVLCANCNCIKRLRGTISYNQGLKNIKEWEEWSKLKIIKTPEELKKLWNKKRRY